MRRAPDERLFGEYHAVEAIARVMFRRLDSLTFGFMFMFARSG